MRDIAIVLWVSMCVVGAVVHGAHMEGRRMRDGMRGTTPHGVMVRAWYMASVMHVCAWSVVAVVPVVCMVLVW